ncbi:hypothetical protein OE88DRAFT_1665213 [Heliocybe sulcata]|uniref:Uncharacterized protein n=1 Tax=Heliocybe sulcata TaxID=5364 RepID=A0A5C3MTM9_9AGAM|nr:hypothetical protein OE88DRAFT_1665213 [Heliocybe sulcata]
MLLSLIRDGEDRRRSAQTRLDKAAAPASADKVFLPQYDPSGLNTSPSTCQAKSDARPQPDQALHHGNIHVSHEMPNKEWQLEQIQATSSYRPWARKDQ